jgi:hypothetical protein
MGLEYEERARRPAGPHASSCTEAPFLKATNSVLLTKPFEAFEGKKARKPMEPGLVTPGLSLLLKKMTMEQRTATTSSIGTPSIICASA